MQQSIAKRGLGIGLLMLLMAMAGCEDPPLPTSVPIAGASASPSPSPSGSIRPSSSPGASAAVSPTPTPRASLTPTPVTSVTPVPTASSSTGTGASPSPSPSVSPSPSIADPPKAVVFTAPAPNADFTQTSLQVRVQVEVPTSVTLQKIVLQYDGVTLYEQKGTGLSLSYAWNPNSLTLPDGSVQKVQAGAHKLTAIATTIAGKTAEGFLEFDKPYAFKGWTSEYATNKTFPELPQARGQVKLVGNDLDDELYAMFGVDDGGADMVAITKLSINNLGQPAIGQWMGLSASTLTPRRDPAIASRNQYIYILGGSIPVPGPTAVVLTPTAQAVFYNTREERAQPMPDLPTPLTDAQAAVLENYLYVYGGSTDGTTSGVSSQLYRLKLDDNGVPTGLAWEPMAALDGQNGRRGGALIATGGKLYIVGGRNANGVLARTVFRFTPPTDTASGSWTDNVTMSYGTYQAATAGLGGKIYVTGGYIESGTTKTPSVLEIDPVARTLKTLPTSAGLGTPRASMGAAVVNGQLFVGGGYETSKDDEGNFFEKPLTTVIRSNTL